MPSVKYLETILKQYHRKFDNYNSHVERILFHSWCIQYTEGTSDYCILISFKCTPLALVSSFPFNLFSPSPHPFYCSSYPHFFPNLLMSFLTTQFQFHFLHLPPPPPRRPRVFLNKWFHSSRFSGLVALENFVCSSQLWENLNSGLSKL